jgi:hypothetical protein
MESVAEAGAARSATVGPAPHTVHVLATTVEGTRCALASAKRLARGRGSRVVLFVPRRTTTLAPFDVDGGERDSLIHRHVAAAVDVGLHVEAVFCVCRRLDDVVHAIVGRSEVVIIGGRHSSVWPTREQRLARRLTAAGFPVVFAQVDGTNARLPIACAVSLLILSCARAAASPQTSQPSPIASPQPSPATVSWQYGGFVDGAYLDDFNDPPNKLFRSRGTAWHVDDWFINMAGAYAKRKPSEQSRWGSELLVQTGKDDEIFGFSATAPNLGGSDWLRHLGLANVSYVFPAAKGLTVQGGIFASLIGYDALYAKDNINYTRPWGADFTPYLMLGVNASYPFTDRLTGTFYVVNGYWHLANANDVPSSGMQLAYKLTPAISAKETVLWGPHQSDTSLEFWRFLADTIVERKTDKLTGAFEFHFATERVADSADERAWWVAVQAPLRWAVQGPWAVAVRPEYARDSTGRWTLAKQSVFAFTTTLEYRAPFRWSNAIVRVEHRFDDSWGDEGGFFTEGAAGTVALTPSQHLLIFAVIFTFDSPPSR